MYLKMQIRFTPIPTERRSPFPLEGKGLYTERRSHSLGKSFPSRGRI